ncbi:MAG: 6-bladed beta-propeller [Bacteroides sp.]|nr:6-bladed beta-propeller [Bacteroides sp.]
MNRFFTIGGVAMTLLLTCCTHSQNEISRIGDSELIVIDEKASMPHHDIPLSSIAEDIRTIQLEDSDEAIVKYWKSAISPNYIVIMQGASMPAKLFSISGKYLGTVGQVGKGPGEYSLIYECAIDEDHNAIYLTSWFGNVLQYDLDGNFVKEVDLGCGGKPTLGITPYGGVSAVSLCWGDQEENQVAASMSAEGKKQSADYLPLHTSLKDAEGMGVGFNNEIFAFRNVDRHIFMHTSTDTLYIYSADSNTISPRCVISRENPQPEEWVIGTELPTGIMMSVVGPDTRNYWVDKASGEIIKGSVINDFLANNVLGQNHFRDGYYIQCFEPGDLVDRIEEKWLNEPSLTDDQKKRLTDLKESLDPESNNIILLAPLKRQ